MHAAGATPVSRQRLPRTSHVLSKVAPRMRDNPVKARLAAGGRVCGAMVFEFFSPGLPQICANAGAEFVLYDMEHTGLSFETLKTQVALCRGLSVVPMVRVPRGEYHFIARALDVRTAAELEAAIRGGRLQDAPGVGAATEARIRAALTLPPISSSA